MRRLAGGAVLLAALCHQAAAFAPPGASPGEAPHPPSPARRRPRASRHGSGWRPGLHDAVRSAWLAAGAC